VIPRAASNAATITMNDARPGFVARGGFWAVAQFALKIAVIALGLWCRGHWPQRWLVTLGWGLLAIGLMVFVAGLAVLGRNLTPLPDPRPNAELVQHGIYTRIRHPLYTGVMAVSVGWALIWQSVPALVVALALIPFFHAKTRSEERWLCARFAGYPEYLKRVPRFLPRLRASRKINL
jgi:protein-S-isoprenylcysteine O-methyltransferase Ste14